MNNIRLNTEHITDIVSLNDVNALEEQLFKAFQDLHRGKGHCKDGNGWLNYTKNLEEASIVKIEECASFIRNHEALIVIGIGGSYLGAKAAINALKHNFSEQTDSLQIYFAGHNVDPIYLADLIDVISEKDVVLNVISKSGTTLETLLAFRILKEKLEEKYGDKAKERIIITTDCKTGTLRKYADKNNIQNFNVPDNIGGRYSVLTPVGLLPIAAAGIDIREILAGANTLVDEYSKFDITHPYLQYAAFRYLFNKKGKYIEVLTYYQEKLRYFAEWYKQLFAESEGKDGKGVFPASMMFSTDLHSFGQLLQDGKKNMFETALIFDQVQKDIRLTKDENDLGGLNYLAEYKFSDVLKCVQRGAIEAHSQGGVPNLVLSLSELNEFYFGQLIYFFEKACAISTLLNNVNPFNQPGVEEYKKNIKKNLKTLIEVRPE